MKSRRVAFLVVAVGLAACAQVVGVKDLVVVDHDEVEDAGRDVNRIETGPVIFDAGADQDAIVVYPPPLITSGIFTYFIDGGETLNAPFYSTSPKYGPTATVQYAPGTDPGCFDQHFKLRDGYDDTMTNCVDGLNVEQTAGKRVQNFGIYTANTKQTCGSPTTKDVYFTTIPVPPDSPHTCTGGNDDNSPGGGSTSTFLSAGTYKFVEDLTMNIGGTEIPVRHFTDHRDITQSQTGTNDAEWYFSADKGLVIRLVRHIDVKYPSLNAHYTEVLDMVLKDPP